LVPKNVDLTPLKLVRFAKIKGRAIRRPDPRPEWI